MDNYLAISFQLGGETYGVIIPYDRREEKAIREFQERFGEKFWVNYDGLNDRVAKIEIRNRKGLLNLLSKLFDEES